jgi:hypothetical protein
VKLGGGLNYVTGPMGSGKSLYGVRRIVNALVKGSYAITNVELVDGWALRVARHVSPLAGKPKRQRIADRLESLYVFEESLDTARRYRVPGRGEARALWVWDESHNDLNNRKWRDDGREDVLAWATQLRKLGFVGFLLSQHGDNTDAALRRICSFVVRVQNQREQTRVLGLRITPWPLFLASWYPANLAIGRGNVKPARVERYFLSWHRHLYDTFGLYHGLRAEPDDPDVIWLPEPGRRPRRAVAAPAAPLARLSPVAAAPGHELPPGGAPPAVVQPRRARRP